MTFLDSAFSLGAPEALIPLSCNGSKEICRNHNREPLRKIKLLFLKFIYSYLPEFT